MLAKTKGRKQPQDASHWTPLLPLTNSSKQCIRSPLKDVLVQAAGRAAVACCTSMCAKPCSWQQCSTCRTAARATTSTLESLVGTAFVCRGDCKEAFEE
eukprot:6384094-Amphidinium_carterae.1